MQTVSICSRAQEFNSTVSKYTQRIWKKCWESKYGTCFNAFEWIYSGIKTKFRKSTCSTQIFRHNKIFFNIYLYALWRSSYEVLSHNLPMPKTSSVCEYFNKFKAYEISTDQFLEFIYSIVKYIEKNKQSVLEGRLRCKELNEYLEKLNSPKYV